MYIILSIFVFYAIGIISYEYNYFYYYFFIVFAMLLYNTIKSKKFTYNIVIILFLILSFINCNYNSKSVLAQHINEEMDFVAKIISKNSNNDNSNYIGYNATIIKINNQKLKSKENTIIYIDKNQNLNINTIVKIKGNISDVTYSKNFLLFDYKKHLRSRKIYAILFCTSKPLTIDKSYSFFNKLTINFKSYAEELFTSKLNKQNSEIILSMILGDTDYLHEDIYENIREIGLAHIFAVSGLHIGLLYAFLLKSFRLVGFHKRTSWIITWSLLWTYGFFIGFPVSILRTLVMFTFLFGSELLYRRYNSLNAIALAALILTIINPFWLFEVGFILSFSASLSLTIFNKYISNNIKTKSQVVKTVYMYLFLQVFTFPVIIYFFNYLPILGIIYNLLLVPIFTVVLICSFIFLVFNNIFTYTLVVPFKLFDYLLYSLRYIINITENIKFNGIIMATPSICEMLFIYISIFYLFYFYNSKFKSLIKSGYNIILSFYLITFVIIPTNDTSIYFNIVDVGQGLFSTVKYKNNDYIFDCGSTSNNNVGEYVVIPYLTKMGIKYIDGLFISHWDSDHYSGIYNIIDSQNINVNKIFSSSSNKDINEDVHILKKHDRTEIDSLFNINVLSPYNNGSDKSKNNLSLVVLLNYGEFSILLPGDIEEETEDELINDLVQSDILILPHHGSKTSSSNAFINKVRPKYAIISYGKNSYGIPSDEVLARYKKVNSKILSTFENGEINFVLKGDNLYYNTYTGLKSDNYYELYLVWILPKLVLSILFFISINLKKEVNYEL